MGSGLGDRPRGSPPPPPITPARIAYRVCRSNPPTAFDFSSHFQRGIKLRAETPRSLDLSKGVSLWTTVARAQRLAREYPHAGTYIATVEVPGHVRQELNVNSGHLNVWATPEEMLGWVRGIVSVG